MINPLGGFLFFLIIYDENMSNTDKVTIGKIIKNLRNNAHLTQFELAEKVNLSEKHISKIERGISIVKLDTFLKLANVLNFSLSDFGVNTINDNNDTKSKLLNFILSCNDKQAKILLDISRVIQNNEIK